MSHSEGHRVFDPQAQHEISLTRRGKEDFTVQGRGVSTDSCCSRLRFPFICSLKAFSITLIPVIHGVNSCSVFGSPPLSFFIIYRFNIHGKTHVVVFGEAGLLSPVTDAAFFYSKWYSLTKVSRATQQAAGAGFVLFCLYLFSLPHPVTFLGSILNYRN